MCLPDGPQIWQRAMVFHIFLGVGWRDGWKNTQKSHGNLCQSDIWACLCICRRRGNRDDTDPPLLFSCQGLDGSGSASCQQQLASLWWSSNYSPEDSSIPVIELNSPNKHETTHFCVCRNGWFLRLERLDTLPGITNTRVKPNCFHQILEHTDCVRWP